MIKTVGENAEHAVRTTLLLEHIMPTQGILCIKATSEIQPLMDKIF